MGACGRTQSACLCRPGFENRPDFTLPRQRLDNRPQAVAKLHQALVLRFSLWFGDEIESSRLERPNRHLAALYCQGTQHDDGGLLLGCVHGLQHLYAVHLRHFDVERHQVRLQRRDARQCQLAV
jgi:hypothetical protein